MRLLLDATRPRRLARRLSASGHDAVHTLDFPAGDRTPDRDIVQLADLDDRVVVTEDADLVDSRMLAGPDASGVMAGYAKPAARRHFPTVLLGLSLIRRAVSMICLTSSNQ